MFSLTILVDLAKEAGPQLKPHITEFAMVLLESLSGLEAPILNYMANRLSKESGNQDRLDDVRLAVSKSSPIMECADSLIKYVDKEVLVTLVPRLTELIKKGLGAATKSGCARFVEQLARHCGADMHPYSKSVLKAMLSAAKSRSAPLRRDFAIAIGYVVRTSPPDAVDMVVARCRKMYLAKDNDDAVEASAAICRQIAQRAPDVLTAVATQVLPLAFIGMHDMAPVVQKIWKIVWSENTAGNEGGIRLYVKHNVA